MEDDSSSIAFSYESEDWLQEDGGADRQISTALSTSQAAVAPPTIASSRGTAKPVRIGDAWVYREEDMCHQMNKEIDRVCELLATTPDESFVLLKQLKWNRRRLEEEFFDDCTALRSKCGVSEAADPPPAPAAGLVFCPVTLLDCEPENADACACGHWFSKEAWLGHVSAAMQQPHAALTLTCMQDGCTEVVRPRMFKKYLPEQLFSMYQQFQVRSYLDEDRTVTWCPAPGCKYCVSYSEGGAQDVQCLDGHRFCFACKTSAHRPASCLEADKWMTREKDEGENAKWLLANTKPCPQCRKSIEKNQGCNHMTCRPEVGGCKFQFCWVCLQDWKTHKDFYNCNRRPPEDIYSNEAAKTAKIDLQRYTFYYERYRNQLASETHVVKRRGDIERTINQMVEVTGCSLSSLEFLETALRVIARGRHVAAWAYVHGFFIPTSDTAYRALFEDSQGLLEQNLEQLHELLEPNELDQKIAELGEATEKTSASFNEWRIHTTDLCSTTDGFITKLLDAVETGFMNDASASAGGAGVSGVTRGAETAGLTSPSNSKRARTEIIDLANVPDSPEGEDDSDGSDEGGHDDLDSDDGDEDEDEDASGGEDEEMQEAIRQSLAVPPPR